MIKIAQPVNFLSDTRSLRKGRSAAVRNVGGKTSVSVEEDLLFLTVFSVVLVLCGLCRRIGKTGNIKERHSVIIFKF